MPIKITECYKLVCKNCNYEWDTKYSKIPAKCPSCNKQIYKSDNYHIINEYVRYEKTQEEKEAFYNRLGLITILIFLFIFMLSYLKLGFFISLGICIVIYYSFKSGKNKKSSF